jgi:hypothetical protein
VQCEGMVGGGGEFVDGRGRGLGEVEAGRVGEEEGGNWGGL